MSLTCNACNIVFSADSDIRSHYATPLHTTNLKRRVADMAPLTAAAFSRMSAEEDARVAARSAAAAAADVVYVCDACGKSFSSVGQFDAHNKSGKHRERVKAILSARRAEKKMAAESAQGALSAVVPSEAASKVRGAAGEGDGEEEGEEEEEEVTLDETTCVFCWMKSSDVDENIAHMWSAHSFFIPDVDYCCDAGGLINALHERVAVEAKCLWCLNHNKSFSSVEAVQQHMSELGHAMLRYESEEHISQWEAYYDYTGFEPARPVELNADGELVLEDGSVAVSKEVARIYKQNAWAPPESAVLKSALASIRDRDETRYGVGGGVLARAHESAQRAGALAGTGTRGNGTDAQAQKRAQKHYSKFSLQIGMAMNQIRRDHFRVATTLTGRTG